MLSFEFVGDVAKEILVAPRSLGQLPKGFKYVYRDAQRRNHERWARHPDVTRSVKGFRIALHGNPDTPLYFNVGVAGVYEPHITSLFHKLLRHGMTVLDVGTNAGWYTLISAERVGPTGRVIGFEPEPDNYAALVENVKLNGFANVRTFDLALFDTEGELALSLSPTASAWHSMVLPVGEQSVKVPTKRLDSVLAAAGIEKVDLLKIDVEGAEPNVLLGATTSLPHTTHVIVEWNPQVWSNRDDLLQALFRQFHVHAIRYAPSLLRELSLEQLKKWPPANLYLRNRSASG